MRESSSNPKCNKNAKQRKPFSWLTDSAENLHALKILFKVQSLFQFGLRNILIMGDDTQQKNSTTLRVVLLFCPYLSRCLGWDGTHQLAGMGTQAEVIKKAHLEQQAL